MPSKKLAILLFSIMLITSNIARAESTQLLIDRAYYWEKLGRHDMAMLSWQELLQAVPSNAEALAAVSENQKIPQHQPAPVINARQDNATNPASGPVDKIKPSAKSAAISSENVTQEADVKPIVSPEPIANPEKTLPEVKTVEFWPELLSSGVNTQTEDAKAIHELALPQSINKESTDQQQSDPNKKSTDDAQRASHSLLADPSISALIEAPVKTEPVNAAHAVSGRQDTAMSIVQNPVAEAVKTSDQPTVKFQTAVIVTAQPPVAPIPTVQLPVHVSPDTRKKTDKIEKFDLPQGLNVNSSRSEWQATFGASQTELNAGQVGSLMTDDNPKALTERAAYWDKHGRADLAEKLRKQLVPVDSSQIEKTSSLSVKPGVISKQTPESNPAIPATSTLFDETKAAPPTNITAQGVPVADSAATQQRRNDLAGQTPKQATPKPEETTSLGSALPVYQAIPELPVDTQLGALKIDSINKAQYWEAHGRSDLAINKDIPDSRYQVSSDSAQKVTAPLEASTKPDAEETARYWDAHGRSDLAGQIRKQAAPKQDDALRLSSALPVYKAIPEVPAEAQLGAQKVEGDEKAKYWEAHGRTDLSVRLRAQLGKSEPSVSVVRRSPEDNGNGQARQSALENNLLKNPGSLQTRLDLAQIYRAADEIAKARVQIDSVLTDHPDLPEAIFASAQLYAQQRLWPETLYALEKVSPVSRTNDMGELQKTAWAHVQIDRADELVRQGKNLEAELLLRRVAVELAVNYNQTKLAEPPPLWKSVTPKRQKGKH